MFVCCFNVDPKTDTDDSLIVRRLSPCVKRGRYPKRHSVDTQLKKERKKELKPNIMLDEIKSVGNLFIGLIILIGTFPIRLILRLLGYRAEMYGWLDNNLPIK